MKHLISLFTFTLAFTSLASGVRYRGIFVNDEDWSLRPWSQKHFGKKEFIGVGAYKEIFALMKDDGLNLIWPAMHEGGYEFSSRPENLALAKEMGITVGTSHCEPMLRNNVYIPKKEQSKWSWLNHKDFILDYWKEGVKRGEGQNVLWTVGMRGIHDGKMKDGKTTAERKAILEDVFAAQKALLPPGAPTVFVPYKEVLPIYNAGLKVPDDTVIMWTNDNFGYIRRLGGDDKPQGIYWHISYHGSPHGYIHLCTTPPAFMWYELVAKCWNNGVRDMWMVNAGDVFQAELLLKAYGRFANDPEAYGPDAQPKVLAEILGGAGVSPVLCARIQAHLAEYFNLGFNRKPEHMCVQWTRNLPSEVKTSLLARYHALLDEDLAIEQALPVEAKEQYFKVIGFQAQFLAWTGIIHLEGKDKDFAYSVFNPLYARWDALEGGKWSGFWCDTVDEKGGRRQPTPYNRWSSQMQWSWNEPADLTKKDSKGVARANYPATAYRADVPEPKWLAGTPGPAANDGNWVQVPGLGTSGEAYALYPVKPGIGKGATLTYALGTSHQAPGTEREALVLQFLPDFALWPKLSLGVHLEFLDAKGKALGEKAYVKVPKSDANLGEHDRIRNQAVQDNFIRVNVAIPEGAAAVRVIGCDPGVVIDRVGVRPSR